MRRLVLFGGVLSAAIAIGGTRRTLPVAWLGSTMTGRCDSSCSIGTMVRSRVLRE